MDTVLLPAATNSQAVAQRLAMTPGASRMPVQGIELFVVRDFLTPAECAGIIALINGNRVPSTVMQEEPDKEFRTSSTCHMDRSEALVRQVESKITVLTGIDPRYGETMQGQHYAVGQQFKPHNDYFHTNMPYWPETKKRGGQRTWTAMFYLNDVEEGGQTNFPLVGLCLAPRRGNALVWNNSNPAGQPNPLTLHQGMPVVRGDKYIITKWYREAEWVAKREIDYGLAAPCAMIPRPISA